MVISAPGVMTADVYRNYRVHGIPAGLDKYQAADLVKRALCTGNHVEACVQSLAPDLTRPREMVATLNFSEIPPALCVAHTGNEWPPFRVSLEQCVESDALLVFDTHFTGFTPLYCPPEADWQLDLVALSGLNGHAFGSFKSKKKSYMWLRDDLPRDLPEARILLYGYDTRLQDSASFQSILDLGKNFLRALLLATMESSKTMLVMSHSLGGIVAKEAINRMAGSPFEAEKRLLKQLKALYFFGVPSHGMDIESLVPMVGDQPNRGFLHTLETNSPFLREQATTFLRIITRQRCKIVDFYETKVSQTAQQDADGKWAMTGPPRVLVSPASAIHVIDEPHHHTHAVDRSHSDLVKFTSKYDDLYITLLDHFREALNTEDFKRKLTGLQKGCLQSLAFPEQDRRKNELRPIKGTCDWLFDHAKYKSWLKQPNGLLWIRGKPGSGKSMLLRSAVQHLDGQKNTGQLIASFFIHGQGTDLERTPLGIYRSIFHQIYPHFPHIFADLGEMFTKKSNSMGSWQWTTNELLVIFTNGLPEASKIRPIFIFIDALDELGEEHACQVVQDLERLCDELSKDSHLRICFSCRHYPELTLRVGVTIAVEDHNEEDIHAVVKGQLDEMDLSKEITLESKIVDRARGVFQWAAIVLDNARRMKRKGKPFRLILKMVEDIPAELHRLYDSLLTDTEDRAQTVKLFQWVLFPRRPLSVEELRHALALDWNISFTSIKEYQDGENFYDEEDMARVIKHLSKGLTEISGRRVEFIHQSVRDYLLETGLQALEKSVHGSPSSRAHVQISRSCIRFLSLNEIRLFLATNVPQSRQGEPLQLVGPYVELLELAGPFIDYAWHGWVYHVARAEESMEIDQRDLLDIFSYPNDEEFLKPWETMRRILGSPDAFMKFSTATSPILLSQSLNLTPPGSLISDWPRSGSRLAHILCLSGIRSAIREMIRLQDPNLDAPDHYGLNPLSYAIVGKHWDMVQDIIKEVKSESSNAIRHRLSLLRLASADGPEKIVEILDLLLSVEDGIGRRNTHDIAPLAAAAIKGNNRAVRKLIAGGASTDARLKIDGVFGAEEKTPLLLAAERGHGYVVSELLRAGANPNCRDNAGWTPLLLAIEGGHESVVKELLRAGADFNYRDVTGWTPLFWAVHNGNASNVSHLLNAGAQPNIRNNRGWTAIHYASNTEVALALFAGGAELVNNNAPSRNDDEQDSINDNNARELVKPFEVENNSSAPSEAHSRNSHLPTYSNTVDTAYQHATTNGLIDTLKDLQAEMVERYLNKTTRLVSKGQNVEYELLQATKYGDVRKAESLLAQGASADPRKDFGGMTPLLWSAVTGNVDMIRLLLGRGDYDLATLKEACDKAGLWRRDEASEYLSQAMQCSRELRPIVDRSQQVQSSQPMSASLERKSLKRKRTTKDDGNAYLGRPAKRPYSIQRKGTEEEKIN